jgi:hypothetical protein
MVKKTSADFPVFCVGQGTATEEYGQAFASSHGQASYILFALVYSSSFAL